MDGMKNKIASAVFYFLLGGIYTFSLCYAIIQPTALIIPPLRLILWCMLSLTVFYLIFYNRYTALGFGIATIAIGLFLWLFLRSTNYELPMFLRFRRLLDELIAFSRNSLPYSPKYDKPLGLTLVFALSMMTAVLIKVQFSFSYLLIWGILMLSIPFFLYGRTAPLPVFLYLFTMMVFFVRKLNQSASGNSQYPNTGAGFSLSILPVLIIIGTLAFFMPKPSTNVFQVLSDGAAENMSGFLEDGLQQSSFAQKLGDLFNMDKTSGYTQNDIKLGGSLSLGSRDVMTVFAPKRVYLRGKTLHRYTGSAWEATDKEKKPLEEISPGLFRMDGYTPMDELDFDYAPDGFDIIYSNISGIDGPETSVTMVDSSGIKFKYKDDGNVEMIVDDDQITIMPLGATKNIFAPLNSSSIELSEEMQLYTDSHDRLTLESPIGLGSHYKVNYSETKYLYTMIEDEELMKYLELPEELPYRITQIADQICADTFRPVKKINDLIDYLSRFPYSLNTDTLPKNTDFVDYFLFEEQQGYCTYFASTLAIMARTQGIPTRYVEGYVLPPEQNSDGSYTVTEAQAHAWVEYYVNGEGWIIAEATPPYVGQVDTRVNYVGGEDPPPESNEESEPDVTDTPQETSEINPDETLEPDNTDPSESSSPVDGQSDDDGTGSDDESDSNYISAIIIIGVILLVGGGIYYLVRRFQSLDNRDYVILRFKHIRRRVSFLGFPPKGNEPPNAYAQRVERELNRDVSLIRLAEIYSRAFYSTQEITDEDKACVRDGYRAFRPDLNDILSKTRRNKW